MKKKKLILITLTLSLTVFVSCGEETKEVPPPEKPKKSNVEKTESQAKVDATEKLTSEAQDSEKKAVADESKKKSETKSTMEAETAETYVVQEGETLESIAKKLYGDSSMWFHIFAENESKIDCWNHIQPGLELNLPRMN